MTSDETRNSRKSRDPKAIERAEQLYRLADQIYSGFSEPDAASHDALNPSSEKHAEHNDAVETSTDLEDRILWILYVLEDLANYAESKNWLEIKGVLAETQQRVKTMLDKTERK